MNFKKGHFQLGAWITAHAPVLAEVASNAGVDFVTIDLEHTTLSLGEVENLLRAIHQTPGLVRFTKRMLADIPRILDAGASGIMISQLESAQEVLEIRDLTYFPPKGKRGSGLYRAQGYGVGFHEYQKTSVDLPLVGMIETQKGIENLTEILATDSLSAVMAGPYDLSTDLGIPGDFEHSLFKEALGSIKDMSKRYNIPLGYHLVEPDLEKLRLLKEEGWDFVIFSNEFRMIDTLLRKAIQEVR